MSVISSEPPAARTITGRARRRRTSTAVRGYDVAARWLITLGGMGTIVAVSLVFVFLAWVSIPMFLPSRVSPGVWVPVERGALDPVHLAADEHGRLAWAYFADGSTRVVRLDTGEVTEARAPFAGNVPTAWSLDRRTGAAAFGFADGGVRLGNVEFRVSFIGEEEAPEGARALDVGGVLEHDGGLVDRTAEGQYRLLRLEIELAEPIPLAEGRGIVLLDVSHRPTGPTIAALDSGGTLHIENVVMRRNLMTGDETTVLTGGRLAVPRRPDGDAPDHLLLSGIADTVYLVWEDGRLLRLDTRDVSAPVAAESLDLTPEPGARLTSLGFLIGKTTLVSGDSQGRLRTWFRVKPPDAGTVDGSVLVLSHTLGGRDAAVTSISASARSRLLAAGFADGGVRLYHVTSERLLADLEGEAGEGVIRLALMPKDDGMLAATPGGLRRWDVRAAHPATTPASIFRPVWYEGYEGPEHVWQSSSGTDDFEPKFGLAPLIFGTIKATVYAMLFGVPLALLAALYTSEFLTPRAKSRIKPTIEMMASLPSVVLGFLAALVIAPFVEDVVPEAIAAFVTVPAAFLAGGYLWQALPASRRHRWSRWRFCLVLGALPVGVGLAVLAGPVTERVLFAGDIKAWLDGQIGSGAGGWMLLLVPLSAVGVALGVGRFLRPRMRRASREWSARRSAAAELGVFACGLAGTLAVALGASHLLAGLGLDPRGTFVDTYIQRNAFVVGFVMGFAVIPIIYTISEDALSAVPEHLRAASLGAGATQWQTAVRIILPTALSGVFSAVMIGFGRAVGETMIVLMAAGNTPVMEWNIFNGFRTLSANIAVELPEAVRNGTHYRMLFLAALCLFMMTFAVNSAAEVIRQRFRRRAYQL